MIALGSILPVGTIIHSMLTTTQFAAEYGTNWILADGSSVTGTKYAAVTGNSTVPDMRGAFLRGKGSTYNPDGDLAVGTYTASKFGSHTHQQKYTTTGSDQVDSVLRTGAGSPVDATAITGTLFPLAGVTATEQVTAARGGNETSPNSITVNIFIRIN